MKRRIFAGNNKEAMDFCRRLCECLQSKTDGTKPTIKLLSGIKQPELEGCSSSPPSADNRKA